MFASVTLLFVRHGRQQPDDDGQIGPLSPLSEQGRRQADLVAAEVALRSPISAVYSSPLPRALATAEAICKRLLLSQPYIEPRLTEFELGTRRISEIADRTDLLIWRPGDTGEDGETLCSFCQRVSAFCDEAVQRHSEQRIAIVSHAGTIDAAIRWALGIDPEAPWQHEVEVQHASITEVEFWPRGRIAGGSPRYAALRRVNCTVHLRSLTTDRTPDQETEFESLRRPPAK